MASQIADSGSVPESTSTSPAPLKVEKLKLDDIATPSLDKEGNVLPYKTYDVKETESKYCKPSPIPRLAAAASLKKETPTAGWYGIEHSKEPLAGVEIPRECFLYDEDRPFVLGKLNKAALDYPEPCEPVPLSKELQEYLDRLEKAANEEINKRLRKERGELDENENETAEAAPVPPPPQAAPAEPAPAPPKQTASEPEPEKKSSAPQTSAPANVKVTPEATESVKVTVTKKNKARTPSMSPSKGSRRSSRSTTPVSPRSPRTQTNARPQTQQKSTAEKGKTPKSPGRGDGPPQKVVSPRTGAKKTVNAKIDVEIVETKN